MRARKPDREGYTVRDGVRAHWELYGQGDRTVFLLPTWSIIPSRHWKFQIAHLARHCRVLVMDGRGNGLSDRPLDPKRYADEEFAADALAVMDDTATASPALVALSAGARWALLLAAVHPERVGSVVFIGPAVPLAPWTPFRDAARAVFDEKFDEHVDWMKYNADYWLRDHRGFLEFFFGRVFVEPHSTKPIEDSVRWGLDTTPEVLVATARGRTRNEKRAIDLAKRDSCPDLVLHIAQELRKLVPDLEIDWLAQDPVTRVLEAHGERIHPSSSDLANESQHIEQESSPHRLHVFEAWRRMDEILLSNFMVFLEAVRARDYDVWIGDEAWEVDYYLHENPELKQAAYVWLTDFVGWLPMPALGERDVALTADYNAEMIEQVERFPRLRDRAIFIGRPEDIVPGEFGPGLPEIRAWTERHYEFTGGYILGLNQQAVGDRTELRRRLGYRDGEVVCIASVGGSGVGTELLGRLMKAFPAARRRVPGLRMIAVAGPRIDVSTLPSVKGVEVRPFVPDLDLHLAACDVALTQGGLSTTMELTAARRPFLYFPLRDHCEQNIHVRHRLERYRAGRCMDFDDATPSNIADAIQLLVSQPVEYGDVETGTAARAAKLIAELL